MVLRVFYRQPKNVLSAVIPILLLILVSPLTVDHMIAVFLPLLRNYLEHKFLLVKYAKQPIFLVRNRVVGALIPMRNPSSIRSLAMLGFLPLQQII
jgi:hypothetical protein